MRRISGIRCKGKAYVYEDYRKLLDRNDIDAVVIGTPDHWHTRICIDAMKAGKDVYCEKPLTLTIDEGKKLCEVAKATKRVVQVGTQQRSDHNRVFLLAVALVRSGRIGKIRKVTAAIGGGPQGGPFPKEKAPSELNWDMWLGQTPKVEYIGPAAATPISAGGTSTRAASSPIGARTTSISANGPSAWKTPARLPSKWPRACSRWSSKAATPSSTTATTRR